MSQTSCKRISRGTATRGTGFQPVDKGGTGPSRVQCGKTPTLSNTTPHHAHRAFTLIETMLAVLIMALLASAAALSLSGPVRNARAREAVDVVMAADRSARQEAHDSGRAVKLVFDPTTAAISRIEGTAAQFRSALPRSFKISDVLVGRRAFRDSMAQVSFSGSGFSPSYAVHLTGPSADGWVVFSGLTGQASVVKDEQVVRNAIDNSPPRRNAD